MNYTIEELREYAAALGINSVSKFRGKKELILTIRLTEGFDECFYSASSCVMNKCKWFADCRDQSLLRGAKS